MAVGDGTSVREFIDFVNQTGLGTIGTPDDACEQIARLVKQSNGGFGAFLQLAHDWANPVAKFRSFELFARHVAPEFQGQAHSTRDAKARARAARPVLAESNLAAVAHASEVYQAELAAKARAEPKPKGKSKGKA
jgi:limonene 1,2-monooxygenase